jgi:hypothetical protein
LILLIATANAAGLLLLAAEARTREMTIRSALGASPLRLFCERLRETVSSTALAALASLPLAWLVTRLLLDVARPPTDIPLVPLARIDPGLLLPIVAAALLTVAASFFRHVPRSLVAAFQIALATALAVLGVNLAASLRDAQHTALGFRTDHILTLTFDPAQLRFTEAQTRRFYVDLLERVRMLPGVRSAALAQSIPMGYASAQHNIATGGDSPSTAVFSNVVSPGYFDLMRIPILEGRAIDDRDTSTSPPVTVVNQELARVAPINSILLVNGRRHTVVGVARTARYFHLAEAPRAFLYLSFGQNYASRMTLHVATESAPAQLARAVVAQARLLDPDLPATDVRPLDDSVWQSALVHIRTALRAVELVGCCGLVLALAGLYAVVASAALRRRREIAIRIAIGSSRARVCTLVLRPAAILSIAAVIVGWVLAALARRLLGSMLPPSSGDSLTAAFAASTVLMLSLLAALLPAARVFRVDPATVLRKE